MTEPIDPVVNLVRQAMGYGVLMTLEDRAGLLAKMSALPADSSFPDALTSDAQGFVKTRSDLVDAAMKGTQP